MPPDDKPPLDPPPMTSYLYEEIVLLALRDKYGTVASGTWYTQALAGALLAELMLLGRVRAVGEKGQMEVIDDGSVEDPLLQDTLELLRDAKKTKTMQQWLSTIAGWKELKDRAAESLVDNGILRADKSKVLLFFERKTYPEVDPQPEQALLARLEHAIFDDDPDIDPRTVVTLSLAHQTGILNVAFGRKRIKERKERIQEVIEGEASGQAAKAVVDQLQAAIFVTTVLIPVIVT